MAGFPMLLTYRVYKGLTKLLLSAGMKRIHLFSIQSRDHNVHLKKSRVTE